MSRFCPIVNPCLASATQMPAGYFSYSQHAVRWPGSYSLSGGVCSRQMDIACGQRVWNAQPLGTLAGLGTSPGSRMRWRRFDGSMLGTALRSACV